jgi:hypothetical protein
MSGLAESDGVRYVSGEIPITPEKVVIDFALNETITQIFIAPLLSRNLNSRGRCLYEEFLTANRTRSNWSDTKCCRERRFISL